MLLMAITIIFQVFCNNQIKYVWYGTKLPPQNHMTRILKSGYPFKIYFNQPVNITDDRWIVKSDVKRLEIIYQQGGFYSDFDNIIDHDCLMKALRDEKDVIFTADTHCGSMCNNYIYSPQPKHPIIKQMLKHINDSHKGVFDIAGPSYLSRWADKIKRGIEVDKCVVHLFDGKWNMEFFTNEQKIIGGSIIFIIFLCIVNFYHKKIKRQKNTVQGGQKQQSTTVPESQNLVTS